MPGFEAVYGYNLVNISHFDVTTSQQKLLYERPCADQDALLPQLLERHAPPCSE
jgi:hypothetical protein